MRNQGQPWHQQHGLLPPQAPGVVEGPPMAVKFSVNARPGPSPWSTRLGMPTWTMDMIFINTLMELVAPSIEMMNHTNLLDGLR